MQWQVQTHYITEHKRLRMHISYIYAWLGLGVALLWGSGNTLHTISCSCVLL